MKLIKKLVIMTGKGYEKGTVSIEKNALNVSGRVNLHSLRNLSHDQYILMIISNSSVFFVEIGGLGTSSKQFVLPVEADIDALHCAIMLGDTVALYGTTEKSRMWEGNIIDFSRRRHIESKKNDIKETEDESPQAKATVNIGRNQNFQHSFSKEYPTTRQPLPDEFDNQLIVEQNKKVDKQSNLDAFDDQKIESNASLIDEKNINDYFLDIISNYNDDAIAEVNYYKIPTKKQNQSNSLEDSRNEERKTNQAMDEQESIGQGVDPSPPSRPPLTEKYYNRLDEASREEKTNANEHLIGNNNLYSAPKYKDYYDKLKEKYGYNKSVLKEKSKVFSTSKDVAEKSNVDSSTSKNAAENHGISLSTLKDANKTPNLDLTNPALSSLSSSSKKSSLDLQTELAPQMEVVSTLGADPVPPLESLHTKIRLGTFFEQIKDQIEEIFRIYPHCEELESLIPESKWVKVDYNNEGKFYVVGVIGKPDYICYGVPASYSPEPPSELDGFCQWLPLDIENPTKHGYWLLFQDAVSGESIKNEII